MTPRPDADARSGDPTQRSPRVEAAPTQQAPTRQRSSDEPTQERPPRPDTSGVLVVDEARPDGGPASTAAGREALPHDDLPQESRPDEGASKATPEASSESAPEPAAAEPEGAQASATSKPDATTEPDEGNKKAKETGRLALLVGASLLTIVVAFSLFVPRPTPNQWLVFGMLAALGGACVASVLSGFLEFDHKGVKAGGTLAVFVLVFSAFYRYSPEESASETTLAVRAETPALTPDEVPTVLDMLPAPNGDGAEQPTPVEHAGEEPVPLEVPTPDGESVLTFKPSDVDDEGEGADAGGGAP
ncbi:MAG: hypothetical protein H6713_02375 [Myxococcales bacterium]|nr:hypothetical protein [Myxococcales bacterium]